jgi:hypothetical protein
VVDVTTIADIPGKATPTRRERIARTVTGALRGGLIGGIAAALAWVAAGLIAGTAFALALVVSIAVAAWVILRGSVSLVVWGALAAMWAVIALHEWAVNELGGLWVAAAAWLGVVIGARRAGIAKWALPLLAYPVALGAIVLLAGEPLDEPWGSSWLWVPAILGPVIGAVTLVEQRAKNSE